MKVKELYNRITPLAAKISLGGLVISLLCFIAASVCKRILDDPWGVYYASLVELITTWVSVVFAVAVVIFNWAQVREAIRKGIVSLKRNPSVIPLVMMFASFLLYSLNLTDVSDSTAKIQGAGMGLSQFCIMLFSLLSMVCILNAFPRRKKSNIPMIVVMYAMFAIIIYCDIHYTNAIMNALNRAESPIKLTPETEYIRLAYNMLNIHMVLVGVSAALVALLPVYSKLLRKINTSVDVEDNGEMAAIEISD